MATRLEQTILKNLIQNEPFIRKTLPYIKSDFFQERDEEFLYKQIKELPLFNLSSLKGGLIVESKEVRENPMGKICERTIGYEKKDPSGHYIRVGLEGAFSHFLKGQSGQRLKQKDDEQGLTQEEIWKKKYA